MEKSISKTLISKEGTTSEESGWTWYFEDFLASERRREEEGEEDDEDDDDDDDDMHSNFVCGSSMVSDAASYAAWKSSVPVNTSKSCKKLSFKKRKARGVLDDDSLEDTASSPANSPKVSDLNHRVMAQRKPQDNKDISEEKRVGNGEDAEMKSDETNELGFVERTSNCTELKKRGLCLVPLSMFVDYHDK
ncbi:hypothetical protein J5N97_011438 [Dioscorea zingiberensis]|uniref:Uncharacterized protein n=1 Tax=Dioscorea zingiberensis TaxID=325984 RepID=A0A9D5D325_9LILI|nr:hypothetical protein J5N97_011438 [Dioscorea zingiberensis]